MMNAVLSYCKEVDQQCGIQQESQSYAAICSFFRCNSFCVFFAAIFRLVCLSFILPLCLFRNISLWRHLYVNVEDMLLVYYANTQ